MDEEKEYTQEEDDAARERFMKYIEDKMQETAAEYAKAHNLKPVDPDKPVPEPTQEEINAFLEKAKKIIQSMHTEE